MTERVSKKPRLGNYVADMADDETEEIEVTEDEDIINDSFLSDNDVDDLDITQTVAKELRKGTSEVNKRFQDEVSSQTAYDSTSDEDVDDLDAPFKPLKKNKPMKASLSPKKSEISRKPSNMASSTSTSSEDMQNKKHVEEPHLRTKIEDGRTKIVMTDDEDSDAYTKFQLSKQKKKQTSTKVTKTSLKRTARKGKAPANTSVARTNREAIAAVDRYNREFGALQVEDERKDDSVPDNIKRLKEEQLRNGTLKLPPSFDDIFFEENEDLRNVAEKPNFPYMTPCRAYEDIVLPESHGVIPASIAQRLRDYQVEGARFMHKHYSLQQGCILGDDMGLGKTIQVITFLTVAFGKTGDIRDERRMRACRKKNRPYPRVMIICPGTLMSNWRRELETWGWWHIQTYHGKEKADTLQTAEAGLLEILITTYDTYRGDMDKLNRIQWDCVIADECHKVKESKSGITKAMNLVNTLCRIGLTGTAIMNKYTELWNLLNWIRPGDLGTESEWNQIITHPLTVGQSHEATNAQLANARQIANRLVHKVLPDMFLRRMKTLIANQLPKKTDKVVFCPLTAFQKEVYERYLQTDTVQLIIGEYNDNTLPDGKTVKEVLFPAIQSLLKLCNHFANWLPNDEDDIEKRENDMERLQQVLPRTWEKYYRREKLLNAMDPDFCGKWLVLKKLLAFWYENQDKVLIFSYSVKLLTMLHHLLGTSSYNVAYLDGHLSLDARQEVVDSFNSDPTIFIFLISTRAGGVGLNITSANKVVIFDPSWNPSHDLQAQDRSYRIGQTRDVEVYRLICAGTIEEIVYARQIYKQQQSNIGYQASFERRYFRGVQNDPSRRGELFGVTNLFSFKQDDVVLRDIINKTNVAETKIGVAVLTIDPNDDDEDLNVDSQDNIMSQISEIVDNGEHKVANQQHKLDPIQAILSSAGVEYTHENTELIGPSAVEENISRRAHEANEDPTMRSQLAFMINLPEADLYQFGGASTEIKQRQFNTMRTAMKLDTNLEFAFMIERWSTAQRRMFLEKFYKMRRRTLARMGEVTEEGVEDVHDDVIEISD